MDVMATTWQPSIISHTVHAANQCQMMNQVQYLIWTMVSWSLVSTGVLLYASEICRGYCVHFLCKEIISSQ